MARKLYFLTGIDTDAGKTITAALLVQRLGLDYWKPVQCGDLDLGDLKKVEELTSNNSVRFFPESHGFQLPASPHIAAAAEGIELQLEDLKPPASEALLVEGAGGLMVPFNQSDTWLDWIAHYKAEVIVVCRDYLGAINHSLLTFERLKASGVPVKGIIMNGEPFASEAEKTIVDRSPWPLLFRFGPIKPLNSAVIAETASKIEMKWD